MNWFSKHWEAIAIGSGFGILGLLVWRKASAQVLPSSVPAQNNSVLLQNGETTIAPVKGTSVTLTLPAGGQWTSLEAENVVEHPVGSSYSFDANDDTQVVADWNLNGVSQQTTINVVPS